MPDRRSQPADSRPPVSCYIRTLNEERRIAEVVKAALSVAREVVVVDCGSSDRTIELAEGAGAVIVHQPWLGNGGQKRVGEERCSYDWLLDVDADEVVTPELSREITDLFRDGEPQYRMYRFSIITAPPFGKPWFGFGRARRIKLYDRRHIRIPDHKAWDQFEVPSGERVGKLKSPLLHYSFTGIEHMMTKLNRASSVRAREIKMKPKSILILRIVFGLPVYFSKRYFLTGLIRGGIYGFSIAMASAIGRWLRDVKMLEIRMQESGRSKP